MPHRKKNGDPSETPVCCQEHTQTLVFDDLDGQIIRFQSDESAGQH